MPSLLIFLLFLYAVARSARSSGLGVPDFFKFHFTDLLFVPVMCLLALIIIRKWKREPRLRIPVYAVLIQTLAISLYFEWYLPTFQSHRHPYTSDVIDVGMYFLGAAVFLLLQRRV